MDVIKLVIFQSNDVSDAQEGDPKYLSPELMDGKFGKPADIFRYITIHRYYKISIIAKLA